MNIKGRSGLQAHPAFPQRGREGGCGGRASKDIMNQAAFLSLTPMGARREDSQDLSACVPGTAFFVRLKPDARAGDERICGTGDA